MSRLTLQTLPNAVADARGGSVVFVSHCLLNQNVRYLGGAFRPGVVGEVVELFRRMGVGIVQMPCPEERAWGGVLKRLLLRAFGRRWLRRPSVRRAAVALFARYTRWRYRRLARPVVRQIEDYVRCGFDVVGIVGVAESPSCGVRTTLDLARALDAVVDVPVAALSKAFMSDAVVGASVVAGEGWYVAALRDRLARRHLPVPFWELDSASAIRGDFVRIDPPAVTRSRGS